MPAGFGDLLVHLEPDRSQRFLVVPVFVNSEVTLEMLINQLIGPSVISDSARIALMISGAIPFDFGARSYSLRELWVAQQAIPDIEVRVSARLRSPDGMLGFEFLRRYREVNYNFTTRQLTLIDP